MRKCIRLGLFGLMLGLPAGTVYGAEPPSACGKLNAIFQNSVQTDGPACKMESKRSQLKVTLMGIKMPPEMIDLSFGANFMNTGGESGTVVGEFSLLSEEVDKVVDVFRRGSITVSAIHNHLLGEEPRIVYLHFQGKGNLESLARTVKAAMDSTVK